MGYEQQTIDNTAAIQEIINNSKQVPDLDALVDALSGADVLMLYSVSENKTVYITYADLINLNTIPVIDIDGKSFELWKNPNNNNPINIKVLQINDIVKGFDSSARYMEAIYLGGDVTQFSDLAIYNRFAGTKV